MTGAGSARMIRALRAELASAMRATIDRAGPGAGRPFDITPAGWLPARGDYGTEYAAELIELVEARNCSAGRGCVHAGRVRDIREQGPGGVCRLLALMSLPERVIGFAHDGRCVPDDIDRAGSLWTAGAPAPRCDRYAERPPPVRRGPRRRQDALPGL